jgi:hypothetical protein
MVLESIEKLTCLGSLFLSKGCKRRMKIVPINADSIAMTDEN